MKHNGTVWNQQHAIIFHSKASFVYLESKTWRKKKLTKVAKWELPIRKHMVSTSIRMRKLEDRLRRSLIKASVSPTYGHLLPEQKVQPAKLFPMNTNFSTVSFMHRRSQATQYRNKNTPRLPPSFFIILDSHSFDVSKCKDLTSEPCPDISRQTCVRVRQRLLDICQTR